VLRVRELPRSESHYVSRLTRTTRDAPVFTRVIIVLHSMQGFSPPKISRMVCRSSAWVRRVIRDFNCMGTVALYHNRVGGRPPKFTKPIRQKLVDLALSCPRDHVCRGTVVPRTTEDRRHPRGDRRVDQRGATARDPPRGGSKLPDQEDLEEVAQPEIRRETGQARTYRNRERGVRKE